MFSRLILAAVTFDVPLICINFYELIKSPSKEDITFVISIVYWCIAVTVKLAFIMISGVKSQREGEIALVHFFKHFTEILKNTNLGLLFL